MYIYLQRRRPPNFFKQIQKMLNILLAFFYPDERAAAVILKDHRIKQLFDLLDVHGARQEARCELSGSFVDQIIVRHVLPGFHDSYDAYLYFYALSIRFPYGDQIMLRTSV